MTTFPACLQNLSYLDIFESGISTKSIWSKKTVKWKIGLREQPLTKENAL